MTLLELTIVIAVILVTIAILFVGGSAWKKGSDKAACIMHLTNVQKGVRGYSNIYGFSPGQIVSGLQSNVIGLGKFVEEMPTCPGNGTYTTLGDTIPVTGVLYMTCSLADSSSHQPFDSSNW